LAPLKQNKVILTTVILGGLAVVLLGTYFWLFAPANYRGKEYLFTVPSGQSVAQIIEGLHSQGFVRSMFGTRLAFVISGGQIVQAGTYNISPRMDVWQIAQIMTSGDTAVAGVTIPEGYTVAQIAATLDQKGVIGQAVFIQAVSSYPANEDFLKSRTKTDSLEGYLFPDTYQINKGTPANDIISLMLNNFQRRLAPLQTQIDKSGRSLNEIIILASLVEDEARTETNRKLVAQVLLNRLAKPMRLDVDATVRYITGNWTEPITKADLASNSPYNTRKFTGLPPTAICNPSLMSIKAVLLPSPTDALYYLTDKDGVMHYAKTLAEHNQNKAKYL
jgi:UPF0755 protein